MVNKEKENARVGPFHTDLSAGEPDGGWEGIGRMCSQDRLSAATEPADLNTGRSLGRVAGFMQRGYKTAVLSQY